MKKLLFVCGFLSPYGGLENEFIAFAQVALKQRYSVTVYTPNLVQCDATVRTELEHQVKFTSAQEYWRKRLDGGFLYWASRIRFIIHHHRPPNPREEIFLAQRLSRKYAYSAFWRVHGVDVIKQYEIIHLFGKPSKFVVDASKIAHDLSKPILYSAVSSMDGIYAREHHEFVQNSRLCQIITACSKQKAHNIEQHFSYRGDIRVVEQWAYLAEEDLLKLPIGASESSQTVSIGTVSRLDKGKGIDTLIYALGRFVKAAGVKISLKIAGDGPYEDTLRAIVEQENLTAYVEFVGYIPTRLIQTFYGGLDIFVMPSEWEGGPVTGVEAMAAGLPIISTRVGAMPERLEHSISCLFVETQSVAELAAAISQLYYDENLRVELGKKARQRYLQANHSSINAVKLVDIWSTLLQYDTGHQHNA